jgi:FtsH-binding integral membrane protein
VAEASKKKTVRVEHTAAAEAEEKSSAWKPTAEAKSSATTKRVIAILLWLVAIGGEAFAIFWVLRRPKENGAFPTWAWILLLGILVAIGLLTFFGGQLWKQANRLDPASKENKFAFFVQNQLGAIITIIAFVPLIVLIFLNKDMDGKQKGIAGAVGIVLLLITGFTSTTLASPSVEQYTTETDQVTQITGENLVFWTASGKVFHLCNDASAVNLESKDNTIYSGTVADAHAAGKERLTKQVDLEIEQCGFDAPATDNAPAVEETPAP